MKKILILFLVINQNIFSQNPTQLNSSNWSIVFTDNFNDPVTYNGGIVNLLPKWIVKHGETRWLQEQVFTKNQLDINDGSLILKLTKCIGGCINQEFGGPYLKGCSQIANYMGSEVYSTKKTLYGYIEAKIKLPSGKGSFPAFWLFPEYRVNQVNDDEDYNSILFKKLGYPEEMDIIEQRSFYDSDTNGSFINHVYDNYSFWDRNPNGYVDGAFDEIAQTTKPWEGNIFYNNPYKCNTSLAGSWHTFGLKWDLFGQYYFLDDKLIFTNNLWSRKTNTESMNVLLSNQILTNTSTSENPCGNTFDYTTFDGKTIAFPDDFISDEKVKVDWVKIWQEKKFKNPIVWASGKSDKLGKFNLEVNAPNPDIFIVGNFIKTDVESEILSFSSNGLTSALQKLINQTNLNFVHNHNLHINEVATDPQNEVWEVETIKEEKRSSLTPNTYTLNNWFILNSPTRYAVGNFDGELGDELFLSNSSTYYSVLIKFMDAQNPAINYYEYEEKYTNNPNGNTTTPPTIKWLNSNGNNESQAITLNDVFLSANIDGSADNKDELIWFNTSSKSLTLLTYKVNATYKWEKLYKGTGANIALPNWNILSTDRFLVGNFYKPDSNDKKNEILCISASGKVCMYSFDSSWSKIWQNSINNKISLFNMGSYGQDTFVSGKFTDQNGPSQLMCISGIVDNSIVRSYQEYNHIYQFDGINWIAMQLNQQVNQQMETDPTKYNYPSLVKHMPYIYKLDANTNTTALLSIEKYKNPYSRNCTQDTQYSGTDINEQKKSNCVKYLSVLTNFSSNTFAGNNTQRINTSSIVDNQKNDKLVARIYPNPSKEKFIVDFTKIIDGEFEIYNELSVIVKEGKISNSKTLEIKLSDVAKGIYFLKIVGGNFNIVEKILLE